LTAVFFNDINIKNGGKLWAYNNGNVLIVVKDKEMQQGHSQVFA
jgi:hypothetical protein